MGKLLPFDHRLTENSGKKFYKASINGSQKQPEKDESSFSVPGIDNSHTVSTIHKAD